MTGEGGYHSSDIEKKDIVLQEMSGFGEIKRNVSAKHTPYSVDEVRTAVVLYVTVATSWLIGFI